MSKSNSSKKKLIRKISYKLDNDDKYFLNGLWLFFIAIYFSSMIIHILILKEFELLYHLIWFVFPIFGTIIVIFSICKVWWEEE